LPPLALLALPALLPVLPALPLARFSPSRSRPGCGVCWCWSCLLQLQPAAATAVRVLPRLVLDLRLIHPRLPAQLVLRPCLTAEAPVLAQLVPVGRVAGQLVPPALLPR
jgi:hypothetical protein